MSKLDPFTVRKSRKKTTKKESNTDRIARLKAELAEAEAEKQASSICDVVERVAELTVIINAAKDAYRELDDLVEVLIESGETQFETSHGERIELVDNFDGKNKAWKSVAFQRYSAKLV
jgi:hypothetical protein